MSIRNATIARRKRTIGLFEQERTASVEYEWPRRDDVAARPRKKNAAQPKKAERAPGAVPRPGWQGA
jgi:hypothetical protein